MKKLSIFLLFAFFLTLFACGPERKQEGMMDTPEAHYKEGMKYIAVSDWSKAANEFKLALQLNDDFAPAYEGLAYAYMGEGNLKAALDSADKSVSKDGNYYKGYMVYGKVYLKMKKYKKALKKFKKAFKLNSGVPETATYVGRAYYYMGEYGKAREWYTKALNIKNNDKVAMQFLNELNEMQMASAGMGKSARRIALLPYITRADAAALFIDELNVEMLFQKKKKHGFVAFGEKKKNDANIQIKDVKSDFWAYSFIRKVVSLGIMDLFPDGKFYPNKPITKADYALFISRIIIKLSDEKNMATKYIGTPSPYKDVPASHFAFNAIMIVTSRGILPTNISGEFGIADKVPGREAVLAIKKLKTILK